MTTADQITVTPAGSLSSTDVQATLQELDAEKAAAAFDAAGTGLAAATLQDAVRQTWRVADMAHHKLADQAAAIVNQAAGIGDAQARLTQLESFDPAGTGLDTTDPDRALRRTWQVADLAHHKLAEPSGVAPGTYGGGNAAPVLTVDERGRVTGAATAAITPAAIGAAVAGHSHSAASIGAASADHSHSPSSIGAAEASHLHDDRYYTEAESDARFAAVGHSHAGSGGDAYLGNQQTFTSRNDFRGPVNVDVTGAIGVYNETQRDFVGGGEYAPLMIWNTKSQDELNEKPAGYTAGLRVVVSRANHPTPGKGVYKPDKTNDPNNIRFQNGFVKDENGLHSVGATIYVDNTNGKRCLWGLNVLALSGAGPGREDAGAAVMEGELLNAHMSNDVLESYDWSGGVNKTGIAMVMHEGTAYRGNWAFGTWANNVTDDKWWNKGMVLTRVATTGIEFRKNPTTGIPDLSQAFSRAAIHDKSDSTRTILVEPDTTHGHFAQIYGSYGAAVIEMAGAVAQTAVRMRDGQRIEWANQTNVGRDWTLELREKGGLNFRSAGRNSNLSLIIRNSETDDPNDPSSNKCFQIIPYSADDIVSENPVYLRVGGRLRQVFMGETVSGTPDRRYLWVAA